MNVTALAARLQAVCTQAKLYNINQLVPYLEEKHTSLFNRLHPFFPEELSDTTIGAVRNVKLCNLCSKQFAYRYFAYCRSCFDKHGRQEARKLSLAAGGKQLSRVRRSRSEAEVRDSVNCWRQTVSKKPSNEHRTWRRKTQRALLSKTPEEKATIVSKRQATNLSRYGCTVVLENPVIAARLSDTWSIKSSTELADIKAKKEATWKRHGYSHPMRDPKIKERSNYNAHRIHKASVEEGSRTIKYQGYELKAYARLRERFASKDIVSQYDKDFPHLDTGYTPDFYIKSKQLYVEVKSDWTLFGRRGSLPIVAEKFLRATLSGHKICLMLADRKSRYKLLPPIWYRWKRLEQTLEDYLSTSEWK